MIKFLREKNIKSIKPNMNSIAQRHLNWGFLENRIQEFDNCKWRVL